MNTPFNTLALKYLDWAKHNKKTGWVDHGAYQNHIKNEFGHLPIKNISPLHMEHLKQKMKKKGLSERSIQCYLNVVKAIFNKGIGWNLFVGQNPVAKAAKTNKNFLRISDNRRLRFLSREDANILLDELHTRSPQLHDIAVLSLQTGMRAGEIFALTSPMDIDFTHEIITVKDPKNDETRQAYMTPQIKKMLKARLKERGNHPGLIFTNRYDKQIREVSTTFDRVVKKLGFNKGIKGNRDKLVFHSLRHTFASWSPCREKLC